MSNYLRAIKARICYVAKGVVLCYVMIRKGLLCYSVHAKQCYAALWCYIMSCCVISCRAMPW